MVQPATPNYDIGGLIYKPIAEQNYLKMVVYGDPGVGKTVLAASAADVPEMRDVLIINVEGGLLSISGRENMPDAVDVTSLPKLAEVFWFLKNGKHNYKTLVIDSLSELVKFAMDEVVKDAVARNPSKRTNPYKTEWEDFNQNTTQFRDWLRRFRELPMHVIMTCHSKTSGEGDAKVITLNINPALCNSVIGYLDVAAYLFVANFKNETEEIVTERRLVCQPISGITAKDRSPMGKLGTYISNPTMQEIMSRIKE